MSTAHDRRQQVAALRLQTRQYLIEARGRRLGLITDPAPEPAPALQPAPAPVPSRPAERFLPDPRLAALTPAVPVVETAPASCEGRGEPAPGEAGPSKSGPSESGPSESGPSESLGPSESGPSESSTPSESWPIESGPPRPTLKALPLGALRLLGQGMIWRLNNLGLHTLEDLAACDPKRLGDGLGPIGRLVRTEVWIEAAREILSSK